MLPLPMPVTLQQYISSRHGEALASLFAVIAAAAVQIEQCLRTSAISGALGLQGSSNIQGEQQQKLDVLANNLLTEALRAHPAIAAIVSEEDDEAVLFADKPGANCIAIFDPLDGSSNIDVNVNVGTIISLQPIASGQSITDAALAIGTSQLAALYVNYGPATMLVYTAGKGTHCFTLHGGDFLLNAEDIRIPSHGPYYSLNEGNAADFPPAVRACISGLRDGTLLDTRYSARYVGSFIADLHRTLLKGGVFLYPPTAKAPNGKLRLLYEANPLAFIVEQAGGTATTCTQGSTHRILGLQPSAFHQRTTLLIGGPDEVSACCALLAQPLPD